MVSGQQDELLVIGVFPPLAFSFKGTSFPDLDRLGHEHSDHYADVNCAE